MLASPWTLVASARPSLSAGCCVGGSASFVSTYVYDADHTGELRMEFEAASSVSNAPVRWNQTAPVACTGRLELETRWYDVGQLLRVSHYVVATNTGAGEAGAGAAGEVKGPADSPVWGETKPARGKTRTNGENGRAKEYYEWDFTHNDIEVYDRNGRHKGSKDPTTGEMTKPPVPGRRINV